MDGDESTGPFTADCGACVPTSALLEVLSTGLGLPRALVGGGGKEVTGVEATLFGGMIVGSLSIFDVFTIGLGGRGGGSMETVPLRVTTGSPVVCGLAGSAGRSSSGPSWGLIPDAPIPFASLLSFHLLATEW